MIRKCAFIAGTILLLLLLTACSQDDTQSDSSTDGVDEEDTVETPFEEYFESLSVEDAQAYPFDRYDYEGNITDVLNAHTLLISHDNQIFLYDLDSLETTLLVEEGWNERLSLNKQVIAYENEEGIHIMSTSGGEESLVYSTKTGEIVRDYILSRDGQSLFVSLLDGDDYRSFLVNAQGEVSVLGVEEGDGFHITRPLYLTPYRVYALAEYAEVLQGEDGDVEATSIDFIYVEFATGNIRNLTANAYGDGLEYMDQSSNGNILLRHLRQTTNEDGLTVTETFKTFNISTEYISTSTIENRDIVLFKSIDDQYDYLTLEEPVEVDYRYPSLKVIKRYKNSQAETIGTIFTDIPSEIFYYQGYMFFNSNNDTYRIKLQ